MRVLFVCAGNICRSPMAEAVMRRLVEERPSLQHVEVASAGTIAADGNQATREAQAAVREELGLNLRAHRARYLGPQLRADLILTMDAATTREARQLASEGQVELLGDFAGFAGEEVEDPYGLPLPAFRECALQIARLVEAVAARLER